MITSRRRVLAASTVPVAATVALLAGQSPTSAAVASVASVQVASAQVASAQVASAQVASAQVASVPAATSAVAAPAAPAGAAASSLLRPGSKGKAVLAAQRRLAALGYWLGTPDGVYGPATMHAVVALQKVAGLARDGVLGPRTAKVLAAGVRPRASMKRGDVIEIDLARQVVLVVHSGRERLVLDASTGSGAYYVSQGSRHHAVTPKGVYHVFRSVDGWDPGPLGKLYRPRYFNGGIAVHGYPSVPSQPASHGCVRVTLSAMDYLWAHKLLPIGRAVVVR